MKVAIYETVHLECILTYCELFQIRQDDIHFLTNLDFKSDIKEALGQNYNDFKWTFIPSQINIYAFYKKLHSFFNHKFDCIILNTVDSKHLILYLILKRKKSKIVLNLHDINNFFRVSYSIDLKKTIRILGKRLLRHKIDLFTVATENMKDYLVAKKFTTKPILALPLVVSRPNTTTTSIPVIIIPGSIEEKRRLYNEPLKVLANLHADLSQAFKVILAGKPMGSFGQSIIQLTKKMKATGMDIECSENEVPEKKFQQLIASSSIVLAPLNVFTTVHDGIKEQYGSSKASGNIHDAVRHSKPLIVPHNYRVPDEINSSTLYYSSMEELYDLVKKCITDKELLKKLTQNAEQNSKKFLREEVNKKLSAVLK